jgi:molecular chaperone DnaK
MEELVAEARKAMEGEDASALRSAMEKLTNLSHKLAESLYKSTPPPSGGPAASSGAGSEPGRDGGSDVVDAEYTVKH